MESSTNVQELRQAIANFGLLHPKKNEWIEHLFENNESFYEEFLQKHKQMGTYTDEDGIITHLTVPNEYLNININIFGTANQVQNPMTRVPCLDPTKVLGTFFVGNYQD